MAKKAKSKKSAIGIFFTNVSDWIGESQQIRRLGNLFLVMILVAAAGGGAIVGLKGLEKYVYKLPLFTSSEVSVSLYNQPTWMSDSLASQILTESFMPIRARLVQLHHQGKDLQLPRVLTDQLALNPWVNRVLWIRRGYGGQFVINAEFCEPTAIVVMDKKTCYLIGGDGKLLPGKYKPEALAGCGLMEIHGCSDNAIPEVGQKWEGEDLQAGLRLVTFLLKCKLPFRDQIRSVDVTNFQGRLDPKSCWVTVITDRGSVIRWGRPVGEERGLETTAAQKLALLARGYQTYGHIDFGKVYVDVRRSPTEVDVSIATVGSKQPAVEDGFPPSRE